MKAVVLVIIIITRKSSRKYWAILIGFQQALIRMASGNFDEVNTLLII
jgi:hypothetical protein